MTIGEKIRMKRESMELSQKELAEKVGLTNTSVSNIEKDAPCNLQSLQRICEVLNIRIELVDFNEERKLTTIDVAELDYDVKACCKQLDKVKRTLMDLMK